MRVLFVHTEQYTAWADELFYNLVRRPIVNCGKQLIVRDFVRNHRQKPVDLEDEGRRLVQDVRDFMPDLIVYSHSWHDVPGAYLSEIRALGVPIFSILWDTLVDTGPAELSIARHSDYIAVCDSVSNYFRYRLLFELFREPGAGVIFISGLHVDPELFARRELPKVHDVLLLGSAEGMRVPLIEHVKANLPSHIQFTKAGGLVNSAVGTHELGLTDGWLPLDRYIDTINQSKILVCTQTRPERIQVKGKVFEFMSCGGFCLIDRNWEYERLIPSDCVAYFDSPQDLVAKIVFYTEHERERLEIAQRGQEWFRGHFDYKSFWRAFLDRVLDANATLPSVPTLEREYAVLRTRLSLDRARQYVMGLLRGAILETGQAGQRP
jgi:hypothetical protein